MERLRNSHLLNKENGIFKAMHDKDMAEHSPTRPAIRAGAVQPLNWKAVLGTLPITEPVLRLPRRQHPFLRCQGVYEFKSPKPVAPGVAHVPSATSQAPLQGRPGSPPSKHQGKANLGPVSGEFAGQERRQDLQAGTWAVTGPTRHTADGKRWPWGHVEGHISSRERQ